MGFGWFPPLILKIYFYVSNINFTFNSINFSFCLSYSSRFKIKIWN